MYAPNEVGPVFLDLCQNIENLPNETRIIGGDFNLVLNLELDKKGSRYRTNFKSKEIVNNWCEQKELVDIFRLQNPDSQKFTWYRKNTFKTFCYLDFLISFSLVERITDSNIPYGFDSGHSSIDLTFCHI